MYAFNELNGKALDFIEIMKVPYPLFYDYLEFQFKTKEKEANKKKNQINEITKPAGGQRK